MARVPPAIPARSMYRTVGWSDTTTIEPGGSGLSAETNGWSIQPPASWRRYGSVPIASGRDPPDRVVSVAEARGPPTSGACWAEGTAFTSQPTGTSFPALRAANSPAIHSYVFVMPARSGVRGSQPSTLLIHVLSLFRPATPFGASRS